MLTDKWLRNPQRSSFTHPQYSTKPRWKMAITDCWGTWKKSLAGGISCTGTASNPAYRISYILLRPRFTLHWKKSLYSSFPHITRLTKFSFISWIALFRLSLDPLTQRLFFPKIVNVAPVFSSMSFRCLQFFPITHPMYSSGIKSSFSQELSSPWVSNKQIRTEKPQVHMMKF